MNLLLARFRKRSRNVESQFMTVTKNKINLNAFKKNKQNVVEVYYISYHIHHLLTDGAYGSDYMFQGKGNIIN